MPSDRKPSLIPTRGKVKLPKTLSYPVGAEAVSEALSGAPHFDDLQLSFSFLNKHLRLLREQTPYDVCAAEYYPRLRYVGAPNSYIESGKLDARWKITVHPVLREQRHAVGELLRSHGLPVIREWLQSSEQAGWDSRKHRVGVLFNPADLSLSVTREDGV